MALCRPISPGLTASRRRRLAGWRRLALSRQARPAPCSEGPPLIAPPAIFGGRGKAPPFRPEGGAEPYLAYSGLLAEGSSVLPHRKQLGPRRLVPARQAPPQRA